MFSEGTGIISSDVGFTRELFLDAKKTGRWAIAVRALMFSTTNITVILMDGCLVGSTAFGAGYKAFRPFAVW
jgi:hypothetical protein